VGVDLGMAHVPPVASGSMRRLLKETRVETSNSANVEVTIASPTKRDRTHVRAQVASTPNNGHAYVAASFKGNVATYTR
jgi:hypothetical protein